MSVVTGLCHSSNLKSMIVIPFRAYLVLDPQSFMAIKIKTRQPTINPRSGIRPARDLQRITTVPMWSWSSDQRSFTHVIGAVTRVSLMKWTWSPRKLADQAQDRLWKVSYFSNLNTTCFSILCRLMRQPQRKWQCDSPASISSVSSC